MTKHLALAKALKCIERIEETVDWSFVPPQARNRVQHNVEGLRRYLSLVLPEKAFTQREPWLTTLSKGKPMQLLLGLDDIPDKKSRKKPSPKAMQEWVLRVSVHPR